MIVPSLRVKFCFSYFFSVELFDRISRNLKKGKGKFSNIIIIIIIIILSLSTPPSTAQSMVNLWLWRLMIGKFSLSGPVPVLNMDTSERGEDWIVKCLEALLGVTTSLVDTELSLNELSPVSGECGFRLCFGSSRLTRSSNDSREELDEFLSSPMAAVGLVCGAGWNVKRSCGALK